MSKFTVHGNLLAEVKVTIEAKTEQDALERARDEVYTTSYGGESWAAAGIEPMGQTKSPEATNHGVEWQHAVCIEHEEEDDGEGEGD